MNAMLEILLFGLAMILRQTRPVDSLGCIQGTVASTWLLQSLADLTPPAAEVDLAAD
jgi:hypothetical protein